MYGEPVEVSQILETEKDPFEDLTTFYPSEFVPLTPQRYPKLFADNKDVAGRYKTIHEVEQPETILIGFNYLSKDMPFDKLSALDPTRINLKQAIYRQHRLGCPSFKFLEGNLEYYTDKHGQRKPHKNFMISRDLPKDELENYPPDTEHAEVSSNIDYGENIYLAWRLAMHINMPGIISTPRDLQEYAKKEGLNVDFRALQNGFSTLGGFKAEELMKKGLLPPEQLNEFYESCADWLVMLSEEVVKTADTKLDLFSPSTNFEVQSEIDVHFLPYLAHGLLQFYADLPVVLQPGQEYRFEKVSDEINIFYRIAKHAIQRWQYKREGNEYREKTQTPQLQEEIKALTEDTLAVKPALAALYDVFRKNPSLLNKRRESPTSSSKVNEYEGIRQQILDAGGDKAIKSLDIRLKYATRRGQV